MMRTTTTYLFASLLAFALTLPTSAYAQGRKTQTSPKVIACVEAAESAQGEREEGGLLAARAHFAACASTECPSQLRAECTRSFDEVTAEIPSVLIVTRDVDGRDLPDIVITIDDKEVKSLGRPIELNPGSHVFSFVVPGDARVEQKLLLVQGEKARAVRFDRPRPTPAVVAAAPPVPNVPPSRPVPTLSLGLAGGGAALLVGALVVGITGLSKRSDLEESGCAPACPADDISAIRTRFLVSDILLGVGIVAISGAVWTYFTRPSVRASPAALDKPFSLGF